MPQFFVCEEVLIALRGSKHLRIAGVLELIIGVVMLLLTWLLAGEGDFSIALNADLASDAFMSLLVLYGFHVLEIFAGIVGIVRANKRSYLALILGLVLFVVNLWEFFTYDQNVMQIIIHALTLVVPYYYLHNVFRNLRSK